MRKCGEGADYVRGVVYMSVAGGAGASWGRRRVIAGISPSGAGSEV
jgi:hypothetical protein